MNTHAIIPLTPANQPYYEQIDAAKRKLRKVRKVENKIALLLAIGGASAEILRIKRDETAENASAKAARLEAENKALRAKLDELQGLAGGDA